MSTSHTCPRRYHAAYKLVPRAYRYALAGTYSTFLLVGRHHRGPEFLVNFIIPFVMDYTIITSLPQKSELLLGCNVLIKEFDQ